MVSKFGAGMDPDFSGVGGMPRPVAAPFASSSARGGWLRPRGDSQVTRRGARFPLLPLSTKEVVEISVPRSVSKGGWLRALGAMQHGVQVCILQY